MVGEKQHWADCYPALYSLKMRFEQGAKLAMIIAIEEGASGLWYGVTADPVGPYKGLLIAGRSLDDVLDQISPTIKLMREAARQKAEETIKPHLTANDPSRPQTT